MYIAGNVGMLTDANLIETGDIAIEHHPPRRTVMMRWYGEDLNVCICAGCRRYTEGELIAAFGHMSREYRRYKKQQRQARKRRKGWA